MPDNDRSNEVHHAVMQGCSFAGELPEPKLEDLPVILQNTINANRVLEAEVSEINKRYQRLLNAVTDYIYTVSVCDGKAVATTHGASCICLTGYTPSDYAIDPMLWFRMVHEADREAVRNQADLALSGGRTDPLEHRIYHKNGCIRWVKNTIVSHYDSQGRLVEYDGLIKDITERKCLEEQLYHAQKLEAVGTLAGGFAHDFKNYLMTIIGYAELSFLELEQDDMLQQYIKIIHETSLKVSETTNKLLAFSRRQVIDPRLIDLDPFIRGIGKMLKPLFGKSIELSLSLARDIGRVKMDPSQLEQVVLNLAVNARDAMPQGGNFTIEARNTAITEANCHSFYALPPAKYVLISVRDTGIGIAEDVKSRIFEPFFTTKEDGKGTGLGLSTAYGIIKQNNGMIRVESEIDRGTTFRIYLPHADEQRYGEGEDNG